jgi:RNA polymerase sigma factor (TIGR02999 family)
LLFSLSFFSAKISPVKDVTVILEAVTRGDPKAPEELLQYVYDELRAMAAQKMAGESPAHTLQPTALVHEAWLRLTGPHRQQWENRAHFFGAAGEAMRRILVDHARRKLAAKRGARPLREEMDDSFLVVTAPADELLSVHEALDDLATEDPKAAELVKLRYFIGMTMDEAATALGLSKRTAEGLWTYARFWLRRRIGDRL